PRTLGVKVSDKVEAAFAHALAVDPRERTRSIQAFWTELETALGLPPSIRLTDARPMARSLTGASEPPPPSSGTRPVAVEPPQKPAAQTSAAAARALAPTLQAQVLQEEERRLPSPPREAPSDKKLRAEPPPPARIRRPEGDAPRAPDRLPEPP